jgi:hypothetical protein
MVKNAYRNEGGMGSFETKPNEAEPSKPITEERKMSEILMAKGVSVYERLLEEYQQKEKQMDQIMTEATFNPK